MIIPSPFKRQGCDESLRHGSLYYRPADANANRNISLCGHEQRLLHSTEPQQQSSTTYRLRQEQGQADRMKLTITPLYFHVSTHDYLPKTRCHSTSLKQTKKSTRLDSSRVNAGCFAVF